MPDPMVVEQQLATDLDQVTDARTRAMVTAWALAWSEVSADLADTLEKFLEQGTRITAATITRSTRLAKTLASIADRLDTLATDAGVTITSDLAGVVEQGAAAQSQLIRSQLQPGEVLHGFDSGALPDTHQLEAIVGRSTQQITSLTQPLAPETYEVVRRELVRGVAAGTNPRATARRMVDRAENRFNFGLNRAMVIARTETLDAYRDGGRAGEQTHANVLAGWVWLTHLGPRTCPSCLGMNGTIHDLEEAGPDDHQQGRCARMPLVRRADGSINLSFVPDAAAHFDALPRADQLQVMGPERLGLYQSGQITLADMATKRKNPGWRDSWNVTPLRDLRAIAARKAA